MIDKNIFEYKDYKTYLDRRLAEKGARSGLRGEFAKALSCQSSFVSQVLHGDLHLSLEQACRANDFLKHDSMSAHFFMLLLQKDRAGSAELRRYFNTQIEEILASRKKVKTRVNPNVELSNEHRGRYYSHWDYSAVHMALSIPALRKPQSISQALVVPLVRVESILQFLVEVGMAQKKGDEFFVGSTHLHLGTESPFLNQHHSNWRVESLKRMDAANSDHLHYSAIFSMARADLARLRENLVQAIQDNLEVVRPSEDEIVVSQVIDLIPIS